MLLGNVSKKRLWNTLDSVWYIVNAQKAFLIIIQESSILYHADYA